MKYWNFGQPRSMGWKIFPAYVSSERLIQFILVIHASLLGVVGVAVVTVVLVVVAVVVVVVAASYNGDPRLKLIQANPPSKLRQRRRPKLRPKLIRNSHVLCLPLKSQEAQTLSTFLWN